MNKSTLIDAVAEAKRFVSAAEAALAADTVARAQLANIRPTWPDLCSNPRENGAVRRASMDLTRKLADLRAGR